MRRLRLAEWGVLVGGCGLLVTLFLDWYALQNATLVRPDVIATIDAHTIGWSALGWLTTLFLVLCITAGLLLVALIASGAGDAYVLAPTVVLGTQGPLALIVLLVVVTLQPGLGEGLPNSVVTLEPAGWAGIACAVLLVVGGLFSLRDERTTGPGRHFEPPPARPAPPA